LATSRPRNLTFSTAFTVKRRKGRNRPEFSGLLSAGFPSSLDELFEQLGEAAGLAEARITTLTKRRILSVEVFGSVRPRRRLAKWIVPCPVKVLLNPQAIRWLVPKGELGSKNPLYPFYLDYLLSRKSSVEAFKSEPTGLPTRIPDTTALLLSEAEVKSLPKGLPHPTTLGLPRVDVWQRLRERKRIGIMPR